MALRDYLNWGRIQKAGSTTVTLDPAAPLPRPSPLDYGGVMTEAQARVSAYTEVGATGLRRHGGYVYEEILRELAGFRAIRVYKEMSENESVVGAFLFAVEMLVRGVSWDVKPASNDNADLLMAKRLRECMEDMSHSWEEFIVEVLSMLKYGFAWHETVYKIRQGESTDPEQPTSRFDDGLVGWRKIPIRSQDSLLRWDFDVTGGVRAMFQLPPPDYTIRRIPIEKSLLFRPKSHKNDPQGFSVLRTAYIPWYFKKNLQRIEAIGIERDLAGLPTLGVPPRMMDQNASNDDKMMLQNYQRMLTQMRRDEGEGFIYPLAYDKEGKPLYELKLLTTGGTRQFDISGTIQRYNQEIAMTVLADFVLIGHGSQGSGGGKGGTALIENKTEIFSEALAAWLNVISSVINRYEVPRLFRLNGWPTNKLPELTHGKVEQVDLEQLGAYVGNLAKAGMALFPDKELENVLRARASLPEHAEDDDGDVNGEDIDITNALSKKPEPIAQPTTQPKPPVPRPDEGGAKQSPKKLPATT